MKFLEAIEYIKTLPIIPKCPYNNTACDCKVREDGDLPWFKINGKIPKNCESGTWSKK